jgi:hypothetical protein
MGQRICINLAWIYPYILTPFQINSIMMTLLKIVSNKLSPCPGELFLLLHQLSFLEKSSNRRHEQLC